MMKKKQIFLGLVSFSLFIILNNIMPLRCEAATPVTTSKPVKLKIISAYPRDQLWNKHMFKWMDVVAEKSNRRIVIEWVGGPEVMNPLENLAPVSKGTFDLVNVGPSYHFTVVPEAGFMQMQQ